MKGKRKAKVSFVSRILLIINIILVFLLLLTYLIPYISPARFPYLAMMGLTYPFLLTANLIFVILWLVRGKWIFLISLLAVLLGVRHIMTHLQFHFRPESSATEAPGLKVISYNVHLFGYYEEIKKTETRNNIFAFLESAGADVICFQEFFDNPERFPVLDSLKTILGMPYVFTKYVPLRESSNHFGLAIFSRYPIKDTGSIHIRQGHTNFTIFADITWQGERIRIYNNHLESIRFSRADYKFYEELTNNPAEPMEVGRGSFRLFKKLTRAYGKRSRQVDKVHDHIAQSPCPVIVCGDFNDTPLSYTYHQLSKGLKDGFVQSGLGLGRTYAGLFPSFRIDYVLYSDNLKATLYRTFRKKYSDHYPVMVELVQTKHPG
ncbi:MAG TPA: endonuclease/exonuclease/phosphatase family protein [Bacteroidales bacterium]|nr:endonuclease/exonuclease/phosphatase family protein [Bacteroidales bacterium]HSA44434.1 endonuclease/exonuclease/phosphatase family protein [Bacteroidales bacterium]